LGGSIDPTSITVTARYTIIGKYLHVMVRGYLTRGAGNRAYTLFSVPFSVNRITSGVFTCQYAGGMNYASAVYAGTSSWSVSHATMNADGYYWGNFFAQI